MTVFFSQLINGLSLGSIYALIALGYSMVYGIILLLNFAHGDVIMVGAYMSWFVMNQLGLGPVTAVCATIITCTLLGVVIEKVAYTPLRNAPRISLLITAIGVSFFLEYTAELVMGSGAKVIPSYYGNKTFMIGSVPLGLTSVITLVVTVLSMLVLTFLVQKTKLGKAMRAVSEDMDAARLMGINVNSTISFTFAVGSALAGIGAVLYCCSYPQATPTMGSMLGLKAFVAAVLGGIGSIPGAFLGGILLGIIENLSKAYISTQLSDAIVFLVLVVVLIVGAYRVEWGLAKPGKIMAFLNYFTIVSNGMLGLSRIFVIVSRASASANRIEEVLTAPEDLAVLPADDAPESPYHIEFRNVTFSYNKRKPTLSNISFRVNRGETLAVIGATGSGKTTLVSLIPRFYDATEGEVLVDGVNVRDYTFDTLYNKLGYVTQKAVLFAGSIRDNVYFGESEAPADDEGLAQAVELSQAKEFVDKLPDGTQHHVAQMGRNMSGGQKQRLSIARALARKPEILVFDDSFSALDYRTDAKLREGLSKQLHDTTKIIVAQRISTIRHADKIVVLDRGEAVGIGTHEELMRNCDVYREIATSQLSAAELA